MKRRSDIAAILSEGIIVRDPQDLEAERCFFIERELHQVITEDYPVAKFMVEAEMLNEEARKMKKLGLTKPKVMGHGYI